MLPRTSVVLLALLTLIWACDRSHKKNATPSASSASATAPVKLEGIDTSSLTPREHQTWSALVSSLLAPCSDVAVSLAQCVSDKRACKACKPASELLLRQVQAGNNPENITSVYDARFMPDKAKAIAIGDSPGLAATAARRRVPKDVGSLRTGQRLEIPRGR